MDPEYIKCDLKCQCLLFRIYCAVICIDVFDTLIVFNIILTIGVKYVVVMCYIYCTLY